MRNLNEYQSTRWCVVSVRYICHRLLTIAAILSLWCCSLPGPSACAQNTSISPNDSIELQQFASAIDENASRAIVLHAGKAVQFTIPSEWYVQEVGVGRQVRLLVSPNPIEASARDVVDGFWIALEYYPSGLTLEPVDDLRKRVALSLQPILGELHDSAEVRMLDLHEPVAARMDFQVATQSQNGHRETDPPASYGASESNVSRGFHVLFQTNWCRCQFNAIAPLNIADQRFEEFERILDDLRLVRPVSKPQKIAPPVRDGASILGSWKAHASRLRLKGDGTFSILTDAPFAFTTKEGYQQRLGTSLVGRFRAQGDLLFVEWDDDSRLNYRWRRKGDRLLMTDHEGRMTQLVRISE